MPMVRAMRMLNAIEAGTTSGAQLQTLLADAGRLGEWQQLLVLRGQTRRIAASSTAMTAVIASSTAMTAVAASSTAMTAVAASSTAMTAVAASSTAMTAVAASSTAMTAVAASSTAMTALAASSVAMTALVASSTARLAVFNSDTALSAISASASAKATIRAAAGYTVVSKSNSNSPISLGFTGNVIMVGFSSDNANGVTTIAGRRAGSTVGLLSITSGQTPINTTATFDNVMALTSAATTMNSWATSTHYFGVLPV